MVKICSPLSLSYNEQIIKKVEKAYTILSNNDDVGLMVEPYSTFGIVLISRSFYFVYTHTYHLSQTDDERKIQYKSLHCYGENTYNSGTYYKKCNNILTGIKISNISR